MALQIRRGTAAQRTSVTPAEGELLYTTDTKLVYVGDGATAGGNIISGGGGISDIVNDTTPQLGGDLDVNGKQIVTTRSNENIVLNPAGTGKVVIFGELDITSGIRTTAPFNITSSGLITIGSNSTLEDGDVYIVRNSYSNSASAGFSFVQHHDTADAVNMNFYRTRGTNSAPLVVQNGDDIIDFNFTARAGSAISGAAAISVIVDGTPSSTQVPTKFVFSTNNGTSRTGRVAISASGRLETNSLGAFSGTNITVTNGHTITIGDVVLDNTGLKTVSSNSNLNIDANGGGSVFIQGSLEINPAGNINKVGELNITPTGSVTIGSNAEGIDGNVVILRNTYSSAVTAGFVFSQHHETQDSVNFSFIRSRGTGTAPTTLVNNDNLMDMVFYGHDGTDNVSSVTISTAVDGTVSTGKVPGRMDFLLHDGITAGIGGIKARASLRADGRFRIDSLAGLSSSVITLQTNHSIQVGDVRLTADGLSTVNSNANLFLTANAGGRVYLDGAGWPTSLGVAGQVLSTDGAGSLSWTTAPGYIARTTATGSTGNIADAATANIGITGFKTYSLLKIESTHAAWIRLYVSEAARTEDASRAEGVDPAPGAGVIAEIVTTGSQTILMSPGVFGWNNESPITSNIACAVTNKSGSTANISITFHLVQLEA